MMYKKWTSKDGGFGADLLRYDLVGDYEPGSHLHHPRFGMEGRFEGVEPSGLGEAEEVHHADGHQIRAQTRGEIMGPNLSMISNRFPSFSPAAARSSASSWAGLYRPI
jgi:hypothetical protein